MPAPTVPSAAEVTFHSRSAEEVLKVLETSRDGLAATEARVRLAAHGPNTLPRAKRETVLQLLWRQINNPLIWVLIASGAVAVAADFAGDGLKNGAVILAVVVLNTLIGFVQEFKAGKAIEALSQMVPESVTVLRDGRRDTVQAASLVPGDIVLLASGDRVPADMRLIAARSLQIEEAALTGESVPAEKTIAQVEESAVVGDRRNMVFSGTLVTYGTGTAVVTRTGAGTELGRISCMLRETTDLQTPLTAALTTIGKQITVAIVVISILMLVVGTIRTEWMTAQGWASSLRETVIFAIALAVGAIPEGLPAIVTIALAIGVQRMAARRAVIRKLPAVETLGSTTVICSDKTGTLTRNEMTVQSLWTPASGLIRVTGIGYEPVGELLMDDTRICAVPEDVSELLLAGALCNDATVVPGEGRRMITGDPTEAGLVVSAQKGGIDPERERARQPRLDAIPFESENQFMATLNAAEGGPTVLIKGAPEAILKKCTGVIAIHVLSEVERMARSGMRVLAFASKPAPGRTALEMADVSGGFRLLGLQGMMDPPRAEAIAAIDACHQAGITVKMITGDHRLTAKAIGEQIGIAQAGAPVVTGTEIAACSDETLRDVVRSTNVFARVAPEHKLKLVRALQANCDVVAMTGDGVNDAPALKQANIGVAMGITGTSVSKEASAVVLADDNFASIAAAVEEGRRVYDNLVKSLAFVLPTNLGLALILMCAVAFFPFDAVTGELLLPMQPTQLLWINLVASVALALPLAFEAPEPGVMHRPPRQPGEPVMSRFVLMRTAVAAVLMTAGAIGLFLYEYRTASADASALARAQTMAVTTVVMFQIFYMLNCRSLQDSVFKIGVFSNPAVFVGIGALLLLQATLIYTPMMQDIFSTASLSLRDLTLSVLAGMIILPVISMEKALRQRATRKASRAVWPEVSARAHEVPRAENG